MEKPQLELTPAHVMFLSLFFMVMMVTLSIPALFATIYAVAYGLGIGAVVISAGLFTLTAALFTMMGFYLFG